MRIVALRYLRASSGHRGPVGEVGDPWLAGQLVPLVEELAVRVDEHLGDEVRNIVPLISPSTSAPGSGGSASRTRHVRKGAPEAGLRPGRHRARRRVARIGSDSSEMVLLPVRTAYKIFGDRIVRGLPGQIFKGRIAFGSAHPSCALVTEALKGGAPMDDHKPWWADVLADIWSGASLRELAAVRDDLSRANARYANAVRRGPRGGTFMGRDRPNPRRSKAAAAHRRFSRPAPPAAP